MHPLGIAITYTYDGDEAQWDTLCTNFVQAIDDDAEVKGRFSYAVQRGKDATSRVHVGRWDAPETVAKLQSRDYFKTFSEGLKALAGETLKTQPFAVTHSTR